MPVDLTDPELFRRNAFWGALAELRATDPVHRHERADAPPFWAVTRHADVLQVYADTDAYSSRYGMRLDSDPAAVAAVAQRMLIVSDRPDHARLKRALAGCFGPQQVRRLQPLVEQVVADVLATALEAGVVDVVQVVKHIPNRVVCAMLGVPRQDWAWLGDLTTDAFESQDELGTSAAHAEIFLYFTELLDERRARPADDLVSELARARVAGAAGEERRPLTDDEIVFNCNGVLAGANETTRYTTAGGVLALVEHPAAWRLLRERPDAVVPTAVEEVLRWTTPGVHAMRTAVRPARIGTTDIEPGDLVTLWNASANRDERVFDRPDRFDLERTPNRHVGFGHGPHLCLGARLARAELAAFLHALARSVSSLELAGEPVWNASNFTWGLSSLPVALAPARHHAVPVPAA